MGRWCRLKRAGCAGRGTDLRSARRDGSSTWGASPAPRSIVRITTGRSGNGLKTLAIRLIMVHSSVGSSCLPGDIGIPCDTARFPPLPCGCNAQLLRETRYCRGAESGTPSKVSGSQGAQRLQTRCDRAEFFFDVPEPGEGLLIRIDDHLAVVSVDDDRFAPRHIRQEVPHSHDRRNLERPGENGRVAGVASRLRGETLDEIAIQVGRFAGGQGCAPSSITGVWRCVSSWRRSPSKCRRIRFSSDQRYPPPVRRDN